RVDRLVLANTAAQLGPPEAWDARIEAVRRGGMASIADLVIERWFTPAFRASGAADVKAARQTLTTTPPDGYIACCAAFRDMDLRDELASIPAPALVIAGRYDPATTPADCRLIADAIHGARLVELSPAHLSNIEAAEAFNAEVLGFLLG